MQQQETMSQYELPFLDALVGYLASGVVPFHTPGHKQGRGAHPKLHEALARAIQLDVSDVVASKRYDDSWTEALHAAEKLAARAFGAHRTHFVANGTSGAIHAMLLAARMLGYEQIALPRESHLSVFAGLALSGLRPVLLHGGMLPGWNLGLPPTAEQYVEAGLHNGIYFATRPSYYGIAQSLEPLAAHAHGRTPRGLLLIDEAHGPHFGFHPQLPKAALRYGVDMVAQSTHKLLGALTQSSMLHIGSDLIAPHAIERALLTTQSTSPSGLLFASLDAARAQMATAGKALWEQAIEIGNTLRERLIKHVGVSVLSQSDLPHGYELDETRLVIRTSDRGVHGVEAAELLRSKGVQVEMADPWHVVALITFGDTWETANALYDGVQRTLDDAPRGRPIPSQSVWQLPRPKQRLTPREATLSPTEWVPLGHAVGRISAETICPYPPGIPVLCPGEEIDADVVTYLEGMRHTAFEVRGASDPALRRVLVVRG